MRSDLSCGFFFPSHAPFDFAVIIRFFRDCFLVASFLLFEFFFFLRDHCLCNESKENIICTPFRFMVKIRLFSQVFPDAMNSFCSTSPLFFPFFHRYSLDDFVCRKSNTNMMFGILCLGVVCCFAFIYFVLDCKNKESSCFFFLV